MSEAVVLTARSSHNGAMMLLFVPERLSDTSPEARAVPSIRNPFVDTLNCVKAVPQYVNVAAPSKMLVASEYSSSFAVSVVQVKALAPESGEKASVDDCMV